MICTLPFAKGVNCKETERGESKGISRVYPGQSTFISRLLSSEECSPPFRTPDETSAEWKTIEMILYQNERVNALVVCCVCQSAFFCWVVKNWAYFLNQSGNTLETNSRIQNHHGRMSTRKKGRDSIRQEQNNTVEFGFGSDPAWITKGWSLWSHLIIWITWNGWTLTPPGTESTFPFKLPIVGRNSIGL